MMSTPANSKRNSTIDLLKFLFAMTIVIFHGCRNLPGAPGWFVNGRLSVEFFFIISGYLMAVSSKRYTEDAETSPWRQTCGFIMHKIARLSPDVFIAWFIAFAVTVYANGRQGLVHRFLSGVFEFFFLQSAGFTEQPQVNGAVWFLSAMLLGMALLFPFLVRHRKCFLYWFAPLAAIFLYGYLSIVLEGFVGPGRWGGFATKGMIRALAGLCLGVVCYTVGEKLKTLHLRISGRICVSVIAFLDFAYIFLTIHRSKASYYDFVLVAMMALGVTLVFSGCGIDILGHTPALLNRFTVFLGEFSMDLFLSHSYWCKCLEIILPNLSGKRLLAAYLVISTVNALLLMLVSKLLRKKWPVIKRVLKKAFLQEEQ